ncbi:hypothetical protein BTVI_26112 [Pitangus sulphuratus]|nr:hypothetical protein BTVI_26112 [Pitangus sulphuratus]
MDLPLAKAKPTSESGRASVVTDLRSGGKKLYDSNCIQRGVRICEYSPADTKPMKVPWRADIHLQTTEGATPESVHAKPNEGMLPHLFLENKGLDVQYAKHPYVLLNRGAEGT